MAKEKTKYLLNKIIKLKFVFIILSVGYVVVKLLEEDSLSSVSQFAGVLKIWIFPSFLVVSFLNVFLEALKWKIIVKEVEEISFLNSLKSVLSGMSFGVFTPYRLGDFAGRLAFLSSKNLNKGFWACLWNGIEISLTTLLVGYIGLSLFLWRNGNVFGFEISNWMIIVFLILSVSTTGFIVLSGNKWGTWLAKLGSNKVQEKYGKYLVACPKKNVRIVFMLNVLKIMLYQHQLFFLIWLGGISVPYVDVWSAIAASYLLISVSPGTVIGELSVKSASSIFFLSAIGIGETWILASTIFLWLMNLAIPALLGNILLASQKTSLERDFSSKNLYAEIRKI